MKSLHFTLNSFEVALSLHYLKGDSWHELTLKDYAGGVSGDDTGIKIELLLNAVKPDRTDYTLSCQSDFDTRVRVRIDLRGESEIFHLIPCNIHGDNNLVKAEPGHYPNLTYAFEGNVSCSPVWEFRADRASHPVSMICCKSGAIGISINPYSDCKENTDGFIRNGVFASLPDQCGVSLGYGNFPRTFVNREGWDEPTSHVFKRASATGSIFAFRGDGRAEAHRIVETLYTEIHEQAAYQKDLKAAVEGLYRSFREVNWQPIMDNYSNLECKVPGDTTLKPWRPLVEIGWTGGGMIAYPLLIAEHVQGKNIDDLNYRGNPLTILDTIAANYNDVSGFFNDVRRPWNPKWPESMVNGWWSGYVIAKDCHCSYTNGTAIYYLLKSWQFVKNVSGKDHKNWVEASLKVLDTVIDLQRDDGCYGYMFSMNEKKVLDWEGFAGCWFAAAAAYAFLITGKKKYLESAKKGTQYYYQFVRDLSCWGTPMDTWKAVDEEGNLAFIRAAMLLHIATQDESYLNMMEMAAKYEFLWRYAFKARPEYAPLKNTSWNSCGGSVTSISNPHIHPMGIYVTTELEYLAQKTGQNYYKQRADDGIAWAMNCLELYPEISGYGQYGVLTERFCPSDGLTVERFSDGRPSSMWFSYNGWAAAAVLEGIAEKHLDAVRYFLPSKIK